MTTSQLMDLMEAIAGCEPCNRVPEVPGIDAELRGRLLGELFRAKRINISAFYGDGTLLAGEPLMLTDAGRTALQDARNQQDADAADPPGLDLAEKKGRRTAYVKAVYNHAGGSTGATVDSRSIGASLGWTDDVSRPVVRYLAEKGLLTYRTLRGGVALTTKGVDEVEAGSQPNSSGTDNLGGGVHVSTGDVSGVVQVVHGGAAVQHAGPPSSESGPGLFRRIGGWTWAVILSSIGSLLVVILVALLSTTHHHNSPPTAPTPSRSGPAVGGHVVVELADTHVGSPVFADTSGKAVGSSTPDRIPYGTPVSITCETPNTSGRMSSVTAFYLIADGQWKGDYVVSDTMTNGGPLGTTNTPSLDPRVVRCP